MLLSVAAGLALMCVACEERGGNPFAFPLSHKAATGAGPIATPPVTDEAPKLTPKMANRVEPQYPFQALRDEIEGRVVVRFQIAPDGVPFNVAIASSSNPVFDANALRALGQSRFEPQAPGNPLYAGRWFQQPYAFRFADEPAPAPAP